MSQATEHEALTDAIESALENNACLKDYAKWLDALAVSIGEALNVTGIGADAAIFRARRLAALAQYMAGDLSSCLESDAHELRKTLAAGADPTQKPKE